MGNDCGTEAAASGLTVWRVLSDAPHYKLVSDTDTVAVRFLLYLVRKQNTAS